MGTYAKALVAVLAAIGLSPTAVSAESRARYGGKLVASMLGEPTVVDPQAATSHADVTLAEMVFDGLYKLDDTRLPIPELATAMPVASANGLDVVIPIRVGAAFHNGRALVVDDVVASLNRLRRSRLNGWLLAAVSDVSAGQLGTDPAVVIKLRYPVPELATYLAAPAAAITRDGDRPRRGRMAGTGPFVLRRVGGDALRLRSFDRHHRGRPYIDQVRLRWFTKPDDEARTYEIGRSHVSFRGAVAYRGHRPKYKTEEAEGPATVLAFIGLGRAHPKILENRSFRLAVSTAINRRSMRNLGSGERILPSLSPESRALGGPRPSSAAQRSQLPLAKRHLQAAARSVAALLPGKRPTLEIIVDRTRVDDRDLADKILGAMIRIDIPARVVELSAPAFAKRVSTGRCDLYIGQLSPQVASGTAELAAAFALGGDQWAARKLTSALLDRKAARAEFARRLPIIPLFHRTVKAHHRSNLHGARFEGSGQLVWADLFVFGSVVRN